MSFSAPPQSGRWASLSDIAAARHTILPKDLRRISKAILRSLALNMAAGVCLE